MRAPAAPKRLQRLRLYPKTLRASAAEGQVRRMWWRRHLRTQTAQKQVQRMPIGPGQENRKRKAKRKKQKQGGRSSGKNKLTIDSLKEADAKRLKTI